MKNVKPIIGQVWECNVIGGIDTRIIRKVIYNDPYHYDVFFECANHMTTYSLWDCGTFIPQNDLEWLAVTFDKWPVRGNCASNPKRYFISAYPKTGNVHTMSFDFNDEYISHQQWQSMRYELGLDDKPHYSAKECAKIQAENY